MGSGTKAFNAVFLLAQKTLQDSFGMDLIELHRSTEEQEPEPTQTTGIKKRGTSVAWSRRRRTDSPQLPLPVPSPISSDPPSTPLLSTLPRSRMLPSSKKTLLPCLTSTTMTNRGLGLTAPSSHGLALTTSALWESCTSYYLSFLSATGS
jgi:hypothetical protein